MIYTGEAKRVRFSCRLTEDNYDYLCLLAIRYDLSLSMMVERLLDGVKLKQPFKSSDKNGSCQMSQ